MGPNVSSVFSLSFIHVFGFGVRIKCDGKSRISVEEPNIFCQRQSAIPADYRGKFLSPKPFTL